MRRRPPIGLIRPLALRLGRTLRPWRCGPLVPMIWRRDKRAQRLVARRRARTSLSIHNHAVNLTMIWPARGRAAAGTGRTLERVLREMLRWEGGWPAATGRTLERTLREVLRWEGGRPAATGRTLERALREVLRREGGRPMATERTPERALREVLRRERGRPAAGEGRLLRLIEHHWHWRHGAAAPRTPDPRPRAGDGSPAATVPPAPHPLGPSDSPPLPASTTPAARLIRAVGTNGEAVAEIVRRPGSARIWRARRLPGERPAAPFRPDASPRSAAAPALRPDAAPRSGMSRPRPRVAAALVWREPGSASPWRPRTAAPAAAAPWRARTELVWRNPAAAEPPQHLAAAPEAAPPPVWGAEAAAQIQRAAPLAAAPTAMAPPDIGRLVDEVVRRLERIGRDERLRRGL